MKDSSAHQNQGVKRDPRTAPVYERALRLGSLVTLVIAIVGSAIGYLVAGALGVYSAFMGAGLALVFMGLTAVSMLVATRVMQGSPPDGRYFGIIIGTWLVKLVVFVGVAIWLGDQSWLDPTVFFVAALVAVVGLLIVDVVAFQTSRIPYVDVQLPGESAEPLEKSPLNS